MVHILWVSRLTQVGTTVSSGMTIVLNINQTNHKLGVIFYTRDLTASGVPVQIFFPFKLIINL